VIRTLTVKHQGDIVFSEGAGDLFAGEINWRWVDFISPTEEEVKYLSSAFDFHHLAIEDCLHGLQRPKADDYGDYRFFVLHSPSEFGTLPYEINIFQGEKFIVTFHQRSSETIDSIWLQLKENSERAEKGPE